MTIKQKFYLTKLKIIELIFYNSRIKATSLSIILKNFTNNKSSHIIVNLAQ